MTGDIITVDICSMCHSEHDIVTKDEIIKNMILEERTHWWFAGHALITMSRYQHLVGQSASTRERSGRKSERRDSNKRVKQEEEKIKGSVETALVKLEQQII